MENWIMGAGLLLLLVASIGFFAAWRREKKNGGPNTAAAKSILSEYRTARQAGDEPRLRRKPTNEQLAVEILETQAELHSLQQQINPHFLYNTLEAIRAQALAENADNVAEMIEILARLFRYNINRQSENVLLRDEMENLRDYIKIQNYRFRGRFQLVEETADVAEWMDVYVLPILTLQPVVENALHHGLEKKIGKGVIQVRAFTTQGELVIQIQDNGVGMDAETLNGLRRRLEGTGGAAPRRQQGAGSGIALVNVHQRIRLLYGEQYGLSITSNPDAGTLVEIAMPLRPPAGEGVARAT